MHLADISSKIDGLRAGFQNESVVHDKPTLWDAVKFVHYQNSMATLTAVFFATVRMLLMLI
jgi:hypothetical protein